MFLLIKAMRVASTSVSNCCMIFGNVSTREGARTIFDFLVILELVHYYLIYKIPLYSKIETF